MKLNHINLTVTDVPAAAAFLQKYFGLRGESEHPKGFTVLFDDDDLALTLMKGRTDAVNYPATFHIGFGQEHEEGVNAIYQRLKEDGFAVEAPQMHHAWTFYVVAPGGFTVEIMA